MSVSVRTMEEVTQQAITLLTREMGVADTLRFLSQFNSGMGNYTEEREAILADLSLEEIFARARQLQGSCSDRSPP
jgi:hypothetical protein